MSMVAPAASHNNDKYRRRKKATTAYVSPFAKRCLIVALGFGSLALLDHQIGKQTPIYVAEHEERPLMKYFTEKEAEVNADAVQKNRQMLFDAACQKNAPTDRKDNGSLSAVFRPPPSNLTEAIPRKLPKRCQYTYIDLGVMNELSSSLSNLVDAGLMRNDDDGNSCSVHYSVEDCQPSLTTREQQSDNRLLTSWIHDSMAAFLRSHGRKQKREEQQQVRPELYCYVGVAGRKKVTIDALRKTEQCVMHTTPRPVRSVHMYTEPTSAFDGRDSTVTEHDSNSIASNNLSTLLKETVEHRAGSHVLIHMDDDDDNHGLMLMEALDSGALCDCAQHGVRVDVLINGVILTQKENTVEKQDLDKLRQCGVKVVEIAG